MEKLNYIIRIKKRLKALPVISTRKRVNLFIIGEQKCGTTSLFKLIKKNKNVLALHKECHYFNTTKFTSDVNYKNYHSLFRHSFYKKYTYLLDASPDYLSDDKAIQEVYSYNPNSKIIIILRNPVERFISAYNFYFSNIIDDLERANRDYFRYSEKGKAEYEYLKRNKGLSIEKFMEDELEGRSPIGALARGNYFTHVSKWLSVYHKRNICILLFENFISAERIEKEIEILEGFLSLKLEHVFPKLNTTIKKEPVSGDVVTTLEKYYHKEINQLKDTCNRDFNLENKNIYV